jgi:hypothetical protein
MATGTPQPAKGLDRLGTSVFSESIISYDYHQVFVVNTRDHGPTNFVASHKKVGKEYQNVWRLDLSEVGENFAFDNAFAFQGLLKILEISHSHVGYFNLSKQIHVSERKEVMEGFDIVFKGMLLEIVGVHADGVEKGGGQAFRNTDFGRAQILGHHAGGSPVAGSDVYKWGFNCHCNGMVINDRIVFKVAESLMMVGLAIHQKGFGESLGINLLQFDQRDLEKPHHGDIVESDNVVEVGDGN